MTPALRLIIFACALLFVSSASAAPSCARLKARPDPWVNASVDALVKAARESYDAEVNTDGYVNIVRAVGSTIRRCKLSGDPSFLTRYREFLEFVEVASLELNPRHELGFVVPDKQYFAETRQFTSIPEFLLAPGFLRAVSRRETLDRAKTFLRELNRSRAPADQLIFLSYESRHLGTPDNPDSYLRLLIVVPGDGESPEKWVQFGVTDPGRRARVRNVSVVAAITRADGTFDAYFKDFYRTYRSNGAITVKGRWELGHGDDNCVSCHKSGILPIFPARGSLSPDETEALRLVNERFRSYGSPRFGKYLDARRFGPGLGTVGWRDRKHLFAYKPDQSAISNSMTCAACHKDDRMGALSWPLDRTLVRSYIEGGQMPKGLRLAERDRSKLHDRLIEEYFATDEEHPGILKSWLLGRLRK